MHQVQQLKGGRKGFTPKRIGGCAYQYLTTCSIYDEIMIYHDENNINDLPAGCNSVPGGVFSNFGP